MADRRDPLAVRNAASQEATDTELADRAPGEGLAKAEMQGLRTRLGVLAVVLLSTAIDAVFMVAWVALQLVAHRALEWLGTLPAGDQLVVLVFRVGFAVSTLAVVGTYVIRDVLISVPRIWKQAK